MSGKVPPGTGGAAEARPPLPPGFGLVLDPRVRRIDGGRALVGGSPLTVLRLSDAGSRLVDDVAAGAVVPAGSGANRLARRLLDLGLAHPRPPAGHPAPAVTAVIPVRDDVAGLSATLARLGPMQQVLVVDDGSGDADAVQEAVGAAPDPRRSRLLRLERSRGPGGARQLGWEEAETEVVAFVDAGCEPEPGWLERLLLHLADPVVAAVAPRVVAKAVTGSGPAWLVAYEEARSPLDLGASSASVRPGSRVPYVPTATLVVRRHALEAVGGFDPALRFGEDVDLVWRLVAAGWAVRYDPAVRVGHPVRSSLHDLLRQRFDYGCSAALLADRHGDAVAPLRVSSWSVGAWGLAAMGHPVVGAAVAVTSTAALVPRLRSLPRPVTEAVRLVGAGHLHAGRLVADACRRSWWPLAALAGLVSRRARRVALLAAVVPPLLDPRPASLSVPRWLALRLLDDAAYGTGVWSGAAAARSAAALRPHLTSSPGQLARQKAAPRTGQLARRRVLSEVPKGKAGNVQTKPVVAGAPLRRSAGGPPAT